MTTIEQAQRFLRVVDNLTPEQRSVLLQAMEDPRLADAPSRSSWHGRRRSCRHRARLESIY